MNQQQRYEHLLDTFRQQLVEVTTMNRDAALSWIDEAQRMLNQAKDDIASRARYGGNEF